MNEFVSLGEAAYYNDTTKLSLQKLRYKDKITGRTDRFMGDKVLLNFKNPLEFEISELYYKAAFIAGSEKQLVKELSSELGIKPDTLKHYFNRFCFKHFKKALIIKEALERVCKNSLWGDIEL